VIDRKPPYSEDSEYYVLGSCFLSPESALAVVNELDEDDLYFEQNRRVFRAISRVMDNSNEVDVLAVNSEMEDMFGSGDVQSLSELLDLPTDTNLQYHINVVKDRALRRRIIKASQDTIRECYGDVSGDDALTEAEARLLAAGGEIQGTKPVSTRDMVWPVMEIIDSRANAEELPAIQTGFSELDDKMAGGWHDSDLIYVAGRPSMGKTSWAIQVGVNAAVNGNTVYVASLEMSKESLVERILACEGRIDLQRIRKGEMHQSDYDRLAVAAKTIHEAPLYIDEKPGQTPSELRARIMRHVASNGPVDLVVVDYLQLMQGDKETRRHGRRSEIDDISRKLKGLAKELGVPVVALSQLSRAPEQRSNHVPVLSDLRESGSLEQDADVVIFLYREDYYMTEEKAINERVVGATQVIIGKQRNGPLGKVFLKFSSSYTRFDDPKNVSS